MPANMPLPTAAAMPPPTRHVAQPRPVTDIVKKFQAFPPAAKERLILKEANTFVGNAIHLSSHHVVPILDQRRKELLSSGKTKKKFLKTAKQLWSDVSKDELEFWEHEAWRLSEAMKKGEMTAEKILMQAGDEERWMIYAVHAEVVVARYLQIEMSQWVKDALLPTDEGVSNSKTSDREQETTASILTQPIKEEAPFKLELQEKPQHIKPGDVVSLETITLTAPLDLSAEQSLLLDTSLPPLSITARMIHGNFSQLWPFTAVCAAEGWKQISLLRQLADLFDAEGSELFHYYAVPHLSLAGPSPLGKTILGEAHEIWSEMKGRAKEEWKAESAVVKKLLGDGKVEGLEWLQLDASEPAVLKLREMTEKAIEEYKERMSREEEK